MLKDIVSSEISKLNNEQVGAVLNSTNISTLLVAPPGSGKSRTLQVKYLYLAEELGIPLRNIMVVTFTNKAAEEIRSRIGVFIPENNLKRAYIGTFHSICVRLMHEYSKILNLPPFTICDDSESKRIIKIILQDIYTDTENLDMYHSKIAKFKNETLTPDDILQTKPTDYSKKLEEVYREYVKYMKDHNLMDFNDIILNTISYLQDNQQFNQAVTDRFKHILVDEAQDSNDAQHKLLKLMAGDTQQNTLFLVGDADQCWSSDSIVTTDMGTKTIKNLVPGDKVLSLKKQKLVYSEVTRVNTGTSKLIKITTSLGRVLEVTYNHKCFATQPTFDNNYCYVYMMYRKDKGFRIGITNGGVTGSIQARTHTEKPERLWILAQFEKLYDATRFENQLSLRYGVPTNPYLHLSRALAVRQDDLDSIFAEFGSNGWKIIDDFNLSFDHPNYIPRGKTTDKMGRTTVNIVMNSARHGNEVSYECGNTRIRNMISNYSTAFNRAKRLFKEHKADIIVEKFAMEGHDFLRVVPASQLFIGMQIPIVDNNKCILDTIISIEKESAIREIVDVEVEDTGILIANDVVSHNSLYSWRSAKPQYFVDFINHYPTGQILELNRNYRSTGNIIQAADALVSKNVHRIQRKMIANNPKMGNKIKVIECDNQYKEAEMISKVIKKLVENYKYTWSNFAVLFRTNSQSRVIEDILMKAGQPYEVVNSTSFYERKEIKDIMSYLKVVLNPHDDIAMTRVLQLQKGIGQVTIDKFGKSAREQSMSMFDIANMNSVKNTRKGDISSFLVGFSDFRKEVGQDTVDVSDLISKVLEHSYIDVLTKDHDTLLERMENIKELQSIAAEYTTTTDSPTLYGFIEKMMLITDHNKNGKDALSIKLMTGHSSKGLEFPVVFIINAEESILPHKFCHDSPGGMEEERRIFFVMMTRAEERLYISYSKYRKFKGEVEVPEPSRFISEIPNMYKENLYY